jgi:N6-adenosine-specific RNA methylase IME4
VTHVPKRPNGAATPAGGGNLDGSSPPPAGRSTGTRAAKYRTIVADPPWDYPEGFATRSRTPGKWTGPVRRYDLPYPSMTIQQIKALPIRDLAEGDARLFLWATNRHLPFAFGVIQAWGFRYRQTLTWKKLDGLSGSVAPNSEFLLVAARGAPGLIRRLPNAVIERSQTKTHSRKPDVFLDLVEQCSPGPYLELFARRQRLGWDTWGNEALEHVEVSA